MTTAISPTSSSGSCWSDPGPGRARRAERGIREPVGRGGVEDRHRDPLRLAALHAAVLTDLAGCDQVRPMASVLTRALATVVVTGRLPPRMHSRTD